MSYIFYWNFVAIAGIITNQLDRRCMSTLLSVLALIITWTEARGSVVVEALCYKPESHGFENQWGEWTFFNLPNPSGRTRPSGLVSL
jgi:hypothetical protein